MNIKQERTIEIDLNSQTVQDRLKKWANASSFVSTSESPQRWAFNRGSQWSAFYTFDIRKIPTAVIVELNKENTNRIHVSMQCKSWLQWTSPNDPKRLSEHFDLLVAYLKGAL